MSLCGCNWCSSEMCLEPSPSNTVGIHSRYRMSGNTEAQPSYKPALVHVIIQLCWMEKTYDVMSESCLVTLVSVMRWHQGQSIHSGTMPRWSNGVTLWASGTGTIVACLSDCVMPSVVSGNGFVTPCWVFPELEWLNIVHIFRVEHADIRVRFWCHIR